MRRDRVGIETAAFVVDLDDHIVSLEIAAHDDGPAFVLRLASFRVDGVGARLGDREAQVLDAPVGQLRTGLRDQGDDRAHQREELGAGGDIELDAIAHAPGLLAGVALDGVIDRRTQVERAVEAGDLEHLPDPGLVADDAQLAALGAGPLQHTDEDTERGGVEERHLVEVDDEPQAARRRAGRAASRGGSAPWRCRSRH